MEGYDYQDAAMQPPEVPDELEGELTYEACVHAMACLAQHEHCRPVYGRVWEALGCETCMWFYDKADCPMRRSGVMRCEGRCDR